jgi:hypothetical protein
MKILAILVILIIEVGAILTFANGQYNLLPLLLFFNILLAIRIAASRS